MGKLIGIRLGWILRNRKGLFFASIFSAILCTIFLVQLRIEVLLMIIPLSLFSVLYVIPISPKIKAIRNVPFAKIFVISLVWSIVMVVIPQLNFSGFKGLMESSFLLLLLEQFLFILAITLPFDVRDLRYDLELNIKTIPSYIGVKNTIILSHTLLILFLALKFVQFYYLEQLNLQEFIATAITTGLTFLIIAFTSIKRGELFFSGFVDGTMILMYLGILLLEY